MTADNVNLKRYGLSQSEAARRWLARYLVATPRNRRIQLFKPDA